VGLFKIHTPFDNVLLFSRTHAKPEVGNTPFGTDYADQYWFMQMEDVDIVSLEYNLDKAQVLSITKKVIEEKVEENTSGQSKKVNITVSGELEDKFHWDDASDYILNSGKQLESAWSSS
jgi:hypothetical protein